MAWLLFFSCLNILSIDAIAFNEVLTTNNGCREMGTLLRIQFAFYIVSAFCLIANHSILNGLKINLSRPIKMRMHVYVANRNGSIESSIVIVIASFVDDSRYAINMHDLQIKSFCILLSLWGLFAIFCHRNFISVELQWM